MNAVVDPGGVISSDNSDLDKKEPVATLEKQKSISNVEEKEKHFDIPLSIFRYKGCDSDFFTSWYNILRGIFEEIKGMFPEKRVLNLALSVLMLPYIASISLGLVAYNRSKADDKMQASRERNETKKSEVSESTAKRLVYSVLAAIVIFVNIVVLVTLIIPATLALATFYLLNKRLSHSLIATVKIGSGLYKNKHQNVEVSFHEMDAGESDIRWDMGIKFPPQFGQLLRDLCQDKSDKLFVTEDTEHNIILKLSANIYLKNGLRPLRNEIRGMLATLIQGFIEAMEELLKLDKKDITYDKLKELLNEFRLKAVNSVDPKLTSHLIQDAYRVAFIQAIKFAWERRKFSLEEQLKEILVEQELKSKGKELPSEREIIIEGLKKAGAEVPDTLDDKSLPTFKAEWKRLIEEKIAKGARIDVYKDMYPQATEKALGNAETEIEYLKEVVSKRYNDVHKELKGIYENRRNGNLKDGALKRKLEDLFGFKGNDQEVEQRLIKSVMRRTKIILSQSGIADKEKQSLMKQLENLEREAPGKINDFIAKMYLEITKCRIQSLFKAQTEGIEHSCNLLEKGAPDLVAKTNLHRKEIEEYLKSPGQSRSLKAIMKENEDLNKYLENERNSKGKEHPNTKLIEQHLKNNQEILKALENLESDKEESLVNEETKNDYKEELESREKIKFAIIEDDLLEALKQETFNEAKTKKLLEKAELEYCLAEKYIKYPVIKTKDNIKHFCQALLSPLIDNLVEKIINHVPKDNESGLLRLWNFYKVAKGYIRVGLEATKKDKSTEGKALDVAHDTYKEVKTFLQYFESSYEEVGGLIGGVFSDNGETFKRDIWPQIKNHLLGMWDRFFKDIEFTLISKDKNISQETEGIVETKLDGLTAQKHSLLVNSAQAAGA
ncbi:hypothetical protein IHO40_03840 [Wolbachia endosymbiont of Mansonella ozzardi]|uniref:hypothetical protein n=1 Tax=Wolbachia endosymbiont of Mansonella ozzardi TaxID=137464 RepID=UPI001CE1F8BC|nr:hypothetical protein [Wolbachia endosymbiont of Mansonella ozzardi]MCA4775218.1 hypothetical protein [Wolbachia endosymbiont of Mansonella ozzardi]